MSGKVNDDSFEFNGVTFTCDTGPMPCRTYRAGRVSAWKQDDGSWRARSSTSHSHEGRTAQEALEGVVSEAKNWEGAIQELRRMGLME